MFYRLRIILYIVNNYSKLDPGEGQGPAITTEEIINGTRPEFQSERGGNEENLKFADENENDHDLDERTDDRSGTTDSSKKWPRKEEDSLYVEIPYIISTSFSSDDRAAIGAGIEQFHAKTCIRLVLDSRTNYNLSKDINIKTFKH